MMKYDLRNYMLRIVPKDEDWDDVVLLRSQSHQNIEFIDLDSIVVVDRTQIRVIPWDSTTINLHWILSKVLFKIPNNKRAMMTNCRISNQVN